MFYLWQEEKKKGIPIPSFEGLDWNDPNALDAWLTVHRYKRGVIAGFQDWALVKLSKEDLLDCAIVDRSAKNLGSDNRCLRAIIKCPKFLEYTAPSDKLWLPLLSQAKFSSESAIIIRPTCQSERRDGAKFYVEDGCGRILIYLQAILHSDSDSELTAYLGFRPDPQSIFIETKLELEFSGTRSKVYSTFESTLDFIAR